MILELFFPSQIHLAIVIVVFLHVHQMEQQIQDDDDDDDDELYERNLNREFFSTLEFYV